MWSVLSKDFLSFAKNVKEESHGFMGAISRFAADVVGEDGVYAGDEASQEAADMPLDVETLLKFQQDYRTYTTPLSDLELTVFSDWSSTSPFSALQAAARRAQRAANQKGDAAVASSQSPGATPGFTTTWTDEPEDETRQRLLDCSDAVLDKYVELVGEAVSPRMSTSRKARHDNTSAGSPKGRATTVGAATPNSNNNGQTEEKAAASPPAAATTEDGSPTPVTPMPVRAPGSPSAGALLGEDDFFDRYFFRLAQLRCQMAEHRREQEAVASAAKRKQQEEEAAAYAQQKRGLRTQRSDADEDERGRGQDDVAVPLFAKKVLSAASGFMDAVDSALIGPTDGRDPNGSDDENVPLEMIAMTPADRAKARSLTSTTPSSRLVLQQQVVGLEGVVHELQQELRRESARVRQLEALLKTHNITIPAPPTITPERVQPPLVVFTTPSAPVATASSPAHGASATPAQGSTTTASTLPAATATIPPVSNTPVNLSSARSVPSSEQHVDPTPHHAPSSTAAIPAAATATTTTTTSNALPLTPPAFKPFVPTTPKAPATASTTATTSVSHTPAAAAAVSPPVFSSAVVSPGAASSHPSPSTGTSPLSYKKND